MVMSPLADPVIGAIFANVETAGLAAASLIRVTLEADGSALNGKVVSVTPQRAYLDPQNRGCRIDVETLSDANEHVITEVQINAEPIIMQRNLFSASRIFVNTSEMGDTAYEMTAKMPRVIAINILNYNIRTDNNEVLQPFKIMYTKPPERIAIPHFCGYNVQLPRLLEMEPDFSNGLYCWYYTMYTAHREQITVEEVIAMTPSLETYANQDIGYQQFCEQYKRVSASEETRDEYHWWLNAQLGRAGEILGGYQEGEAKGLAKGRVEGEAKGLAKGRTEGEAKGLAKGLAKGEAKGIADVARRMKQSGTMTTAEISKLTMLSIAEIEML